MTKVPEKGEKVSWDTPQGKTEGTVEKVVTNTTKVKSHTAKATKEDPQVVVRSVKSGKQAVHKPEELKKAQSGVITIPVESKEMSIDRHPSQHPQGACRAAGAS